LLIAYIDNTFKEPLLFKTATKGELAEMPRGILHKYNWGELHKIFIPNGEKKTSAGMTAEEMDHWRKTRQENWHGRKFENRLG
jgi:inosine/xanthosine triphosphate pyrophosphatase family protein